MKLNNKNLVSSRLESVSNFDQSEYNIFYIEDYLKDASVSEARKLTDKVFLNNKEFISKYEYASYRITWSWYSDIFQFFISYLEICKLIEEIDLLGSNSLIINKIPHKYSKVLETYFFNKIVTQNISKNTFIVSIKVFVFNLFMLVYSFISIIFLVIKKKKRVATYTGDFVYKNTRSDFRLNHLYKKYEDNNVNYIEFIRETTSINFFINIFKRKRPAIYFTSIIYFVNLFTKKSQYSKKPLDFYQSVLFRFHHSNVVFLKSLTIFKKILKILRIKSFVLFSFSSRSAHLAVAAKSLNIKTIGLMHGLQQKEYACYEFMESYNESKKIGCDVYGVWSQYYADYFQKYSKIISSDAIQYSGLLRPIDNFDESISFKRISNEKIKVLVISEPLVSVKEIIPYLRTLLNRTNIEIAFKVRPMIRDKYYEDMLMELPEIASLKKYDCKIEEAALDYDVFIGSHSTAVIEASLYGKISILVNTIKFGDYFDMNSLAPNNELLVSDPHLLYENIMNRVKNEYALKTCQDIRKRFFGENRDGSEWVMEQL